MKPIAVLAILCCLIPAVAGQTAAVYKPPLQMADECEGTPDKFLCLAIRKGSELLEQQINCEVVQSYTQKAWDGRVLTKRPDEYYVVVQKGTEAFYKLDGAGGLGPAMARPAYQAVKIYAPASWYSTPAMIFQRGQFSDKRELNGRVIYSYSVVNSFALTSGYLETTVDVTGEIEFDKAGLLRRIHLKYNMAPEQMRRHKFKFSEQETVFDNPPGFEEVQPVPVKFWAKLATTYGDKVVIETTYSDYTRFETDVVFGEATEEVKPTTKRRIDGRIIEIKQTP